MAGPWENYQPAPQSSQPPQSGPWDRYSQPPAAKQEPYSGSVLPLSRDADGNISFDANAGILGAVKQAFTAPGRAMSGELQLTGPDGRTSDEAIAEGLNFAGVVSPMTPELRAGGYAIPGQRSAMAKAKVEVPSEEALKAAARDGYQDARALGVDYKTQAVNDLSGEIQTKLTQDGIIGTLAPKTYSVLAGLADSPAGSVASLDGLTAARKAFGNAANDFTNPTEQLAAKRAIEAIDEFLARSDPATVANGSAEQVAPILADARGNYAAAKRSQTLTDLEDAAELRANAANSGANGGNSARQRIANLLLNNKKSAGFGEEDIAALRAVNEGSFAANATRRVGNMLGGGGGIGASLIGLLGAGAGTATGQPGFAAAGAALPLVGIASREASNFLTERALRAVAENTRRRSPLYEEMLANAPYVRSGPEKMEGLVRALIAGSGSQTTPDMAQQLKDEALLQAVSQAPKRR